MCQLQAKGHPGTLSSKKSLLVYKDPVPLLSIDLTRVKDNVSTPKSDPLGVIFIFNWVGLRPLPFPLPFEVTTRLISAKYININENVNRDVC